MTSKTIEQNEENGARYKSSSSWNDDDKGREHLGHTNINNNHK